MQLAYGFTMQAASKTDPTLAVAAYHPVQGCSESAEGMQLGSVCRSVPKPKYTFKVKCPDGRLDCHTEYRYPTNWGKVSALPSITVTEPRRGSKKGAVGNGRSSGTVATSTAPAEPSQPIPQQIATQLVRQGIMYAAQTKAAAAGFAAGSALGGVGGLVGAPLASWAVCTPLKYSFIYQDWARKERWDLHPEKATGNWWYSVKMCSPLAFFFRFQEETEPHRKLFALAGGLSYSPELYSSLLGQVGPGVPSILDNLKLVGSAFSFSGSKQLPTEQRKPYRSEPWALAIP